MCKLGYFATKRSSISPQPPNYHNTQAVHMDNQAISTSLVNAELARHEKSLSPSPTGSAAAATAANHSHYPATVHQAI